MSGRPREQADLKKIFEGIKQIQRDYYLKPQDGSDQTDRASLVLTEILKLLGDRKQDDENDEDQEPPSEEDYDEETADDNNNLTIQEENNPYEKNLVSPMRVVRKSFWGHHRESVKEHVQESERAREHSDSILNDIDDKGGEAEAFWEPVSGGGKGKVKKRLKTKNDPVKNDLANTEPQNFEPSLNFRQSDSSLNDSGFDFQQYEK